MLPHFLIIGAHKAGTTSLHHYFEQHPQVFMTAVKEPNFFSFDASNPAHVGEAASQFRVRSVEEYEALFAAADPAAVRGEASPSYLTSYLAPQRIRQVLPDCRLIVSIRNPVDRTYSAYQMGVRAGRITKRVEDLDPSTDALFRPGLYAGALRTYFDLFGRQAVKVVLFDDLNARPSALMSELFRFVGVDPGFQVDTSYRFNPGGLPARPGLHRFLNSLKRIPGLQRYAPKRWRSALRKVRDGNLQKADPLDAQVRERWEDYFRDDIRRTEQLLGIDLSRWLTAERRPVSGLEPAR
jgi:hypothetical protein